MPQQTGQHEWSAYTDSQALKELAGLRAVTPSVRFLEKLPEKLPASGTKQKIYHVRQDELIYLSGVEMFQDGTDCVSITKIDSLGTETELASGGTAISTFLNLKKKIHNVSVYEYPPFEDFWVEPYLVNNASKQIVKSNFFRAFKFLDEGYYRIQLNERLNPLTGSAGFVANYSSPQYAGVTKLYAKSFMNNFKNYSTAFNNYNDSNSLAPIQAIRNEGEFKREILIRVISKNKDIVTGNPITRRIINAIPGKSDLLSNYPNSNPNASIVIGDIAPSPIYYKGNGTFFVQNKKWNIDSVLTSGTQIGFYDYASEGYNYFFDIRKVTNNQLEELYTDSNMELAPISRKIYVGGRNNDGTELGFAASSTDSLRNIKIINLRNSIIENITFIGGDDGNDAPLKAPSYRYTPNNLLNDTSSTGKSNVVCATIDLSGSVFKNCTIIGSNFWRLGFENDSGNITSRYLLDGCVFENCKFVSSTFNSGSRYSGILHNKCTFENKSRGENSSPIGMYEGDGMCWMSCMWNTLGRFIFLEDQGMVSNNTIIRCHEKNRGMHGNAGEGVVVDAAIGGKDDADSEGWSYGNDFQYWKVTLNLVLFNETSNSFQNLNNVYSFFGKTKFNLGAFNTSYNNGSGYLQGKSANSTKFVIDPTTGLPSGYATKQLAMDTRDDNRARNNNYNVTMHCSSSFSDNSALSIANNSNFNRVLNCVWEGIGKASVGHTTYPRVRMTFYTSSNIISCQNSGGNNFLGPISNLVNNCTIINYNDSGAEPHNYQVSKTGIFNHSISAFYGQKAEVTNPTNVYYRGFKYKDWLNSWPYYTNTTTNPYGMHPNGETDAQLKTRLDNEENVLHNLTKISLRDT